jgi:hypothetical protein
VAYKVKSGVHYGYQDKDHIEDHLRSLQEPHEREGKHNADEKDDKASYVEGVHTWFEALVNLFSFILNETMMFVLI